MRILGIMFLFGKIKWNDSTDISIMQRAVACLIASGVVSIILGLPVLGLIYLIMI